MNDASHLNYCPEETYHFRGRFEQIINTPHHAEGRVDPKVLAL
jgi:hypothetical protein